MQKGSVGLSRMFYCIDQGRHFSFQKIEDAQSNMRANIGGGEPDRRRAVERIRIILLEKQPQGLIPARALVPHPRDTAGGGAQDRSLCADDRARAGVGKEDGVESCCRSPLLSRPCRTAVGGVKNGAVEPDDRSMLSCHEMHIVEIVRGAARLLVPSNAAIGGAKDQAHGADDSSVLCIGEVDAKQVIAPCRCAPYPCQSAVGSLENPA